MKTATKVNCLYCGAEAIQKTVKQRVFCTIKCKNAFWIRDPEYKKRLRERAKEIREEVLDHYGGKCACCGESMYEFLAFDHINGGGTQFRKNRKHSSIALYLKCNGYPDNIRVLCHNCNSAFGFYGKCPHEEL